ncbi:HAMP domain-containing protein [Thiomicrospira microaerophila]|uniref:methyl-accepting chemotaxis protein n=1 Tax=Thiomicrospira microaerophila TaxID=406020 RepID=UPI00200C2FE9|nr:methyl-accepting chemotaxis protein [Thiomicrospira microaerophila]UQB41639.1 HAMP domain-containing protein [Thiomicrospira microaerophila]
MFQSLKNQLAAFAVGAVLVTAAILFTLNYFEEQRAGHQIYQERAQSQAGLVARMSANATLRLSENLTQATRNPLLLEAVLKRNIDEIGRHAFTYENRLAASEIITGLRVVDRQGVILYSRNKEEIGRNLGLSVVQQAMDQTLIKSGLEVYNGVLQNHFAFPLTQRGKTFAALHFYTDPHQTFAQLSRLTGAEYWVFTAMSGDIIAAHDQAEAIIELAGDRVGQLAKASLDFNAKTYSVVGSPLQDYQGQRIGVLTTFVDETEAYKLANRATLVGLLAIIGWLIIAVVATYVFVSIKLRPLVQMREIAAEIEAQGDLSKRLEIKGQDEIAQSAQAINQVLGLVDQLVGESNRVLEAVSKGNFEQQLNPGDYHGDLAYFAQGLNGSVESVRFTMGELERVVTSLYQGDLNVKMDPRVQGTIQNKMNDLTQSLSSIFDEVNRVMAKIKDSDFSEVVEVSARGELAVLVSAINDSINNLSQGFSEVVSASRRIANGDFTQAIEGDYKFAMLEAQQAINQSMLDLGQTIATVNRSVVAIVDSVSQLAEGAVALDDRTRQQATSLEETRSAMSHTSKLVASNAASTERAHQIAQEQTRLLHDTNASMGETQKAMQGIKAVSSQIQDITSLIDSISFQTNLLALNAAVEAARAGDHGRGFAVVAGEVRTLAGKSADAAKNIGGLIDKAVHSVEQGVAKVDHVNGFLERITNETSKMQQIVSSITESSAQQAQGVLEVNQSVGHIEGVTQQNADLVKQTRQSVEQMQLVSDQLTLLMSRFKISEASVAQLGHNDKVDRARVRLAEPEAQAKSQPVVIKSASKVNKVEKKVDAHEEWAEF